VDTSEMKDLLSGYLRELNWTGGATKDQLVAHLAGRDETLRTMVNEYVAEGSYRDVDHVLYVLPEQAWQDAQGDQWRGSETDDPAETVSHFKDGPVGRAEASNRGASATSASLRGASGRGGVGEVGSNAGEVDPGVSGSAETIGRAPQRREAGFGNAIGGAGGGDAASGADDVGA
jgi:hypothetical protein